MMKRFSLIKKTVLPLLLLTFFIQTIHPTPQNNPYDPLPFHSVVGLNKFWAKKSKFAPSLQLSPFYQHASKARDSNGRRVPKGDMLGRWNMIGLLRGEKGDAATNNKIKATPTDKTLSTASNGQDYLILGKAYRILGHHPNADEDSLGYDYTETSSFFNDRDGHFSIPIEYEKIGLRAQFNFDFGFGFGLNIKSGFVDYKQIPTFNDRTGYTLDADGNEVPPSGELSPPQSFIQKYLMAEDNRTKIFKELGLDVNAKRETAMEDTHLQVYWSFPFDLKDNDEHIVTWVPYVSVGVWAPTGKSKKIDEAFSLPTGNDGFIGFTFEGAMSFDFPGMVQIGLGGGASVYGSKDYDNYRVPSDKFQSGIYPWKAKIQRSPGTVWYANASFKADHFVDNMSFYFDYVYLVHQKDSITMMESDQTRNDLFKPKMLEQDSQWRSAMIHGGMNYQVTPGLGLGLSFQTHLSGRKVYRNTTILGTISLEF